MKIACKKTVEHWTYVTMTQNTNYVREREREREREHKANIKHFWRHFMMQFSHEIELSILARFAQYIFRALNLS